jgi:hypothetical protein
MVQNKKDAANSRGAIVIKTYLIYKLNIENESLQYELLILSIVLIELFSNLYDMKHNY